MSEQMLAPEDQIMQWITSKWITKPICVVVELGIADLLRDGPLGVDTLAEKTETHAPTLYRLLRALSSVGIFLEKEEYVFELTALSRCLLSEAMGPMAQLFLSEWHDKAWNSLTYTVKTGKPGFDHAFGKQSFDWIEENPSVRSIYDKAQGMKAVELADAVSEVYNFSGFSSICDVGGGRGSFLIQLLGKYSHINGFVADIQGAVRSAERAIAKAGLDDRCKAVFYDFLKDAPPVCDAYFLVNILHDWNDKICCQILKNISQSMNTKSKLWIVEYLLEQGPGFSVAKLLDIEVLVMGDGRERTIDEFKAILDSVGLEISEVIPTGHGVALLECKLGYQ
ncbi:MAG: hypothetical protein JRE36_09005 [Deltaproteobacteria bacterium]|nr:hypothetical protein [Deltaproteobacteria bacterium]